MQTLEVLKKNDLDFLLSNKYQTLIDKIFLFHQLASSSNNNLIQILPKLLINSYTLDRKFYEHLESIILKLDEIQYFPLAYSFNPYLGKKDILRHAISNLLNSIIVVEVQKEDGIQYMQSLIIKYSSVIKFNYISVIKINDIDQANTISHPILCLFREKMWQSIEQWIKEEPEILMTWDMENKTPLISKILLFKGCADASLKSLQNLSIEKYLSCGMYKFFESSKKITDPYIQLFIEYKSSKDKDNPLKYFNEKICSTEFDHAEFISKSQTFKFICELGENDLIESLKDKLKTDGARSHNALESLIKNSINSFWYSNDQKSDPISAKKFRQTTTLLNEMIANSTTKPVVDMQISNNRISLAFNGEINLKHSLDLSFADHRIIIKNPDDKKDSWIDLYNNTILTIAHQFLWYSGPIQMPDPASYIKLSLLNLGHPDNHKIGEDNRQETLYKAFDQLFQDDPKHMFFEELTEATSYLWYDIFHLGYERGKSLLEFFIDKNKSNNGVLKYFFKPKSQTLQDFIIPQFEANNNREKKCLILRFIRESILRNDLDELMKWIEYGKKEPILIEHSLSMSVELININAVNKVLDTFPNAIISNKNESARNLFTILYEYSNSEFMNHNQYRDSINAIAVKLLEYGYPIELIEVSSNHPQSKDFVRDLISSQVDYSIKLSAISWINESLKHIPFVNIATRCSSVLVEAKIAEKFYTDIYSQSHDFIKDKISEFFTTQNKKVDISQFCHAFSSKLQQDPQTFIERLENVTFLTGFQKQVLDRDSLICNAKTLSKILPVKFEQHLKAFNNGMSQPITLEEISNSVSNKQTYRIENTNQQGNDFLLYKLNLYKQKTLPIIAISNQNYMNISEGITSGISNFGAGIITGGAMCLNDKHKLQGFILFFPVLLSSISIIMNVGYAIGNTTIGFSNLIFSDSRILYTALSIMAAYYILQKASKDPRYYNLHQWTPTELKKLDNKTLENTEQKYPIKQISDENIYKFIKQLLNSLINPKFISMDKFISHEAFFKLMQRFNIDSEKLSNAINSLQNKASDDKTSAALFIITYAVSLPAIYINMKNPDIALPVLIDHYKVERHELYLDLLYRSKNMPVEIIHKIENDLFLKFMLELSKGLKNCKEDENTVSKIFKQKQVGCYSLE